MYQARLEMHMLQSTAHYRCTLAAVNGSIMWQAFGAWKDTRESPNPPDYNQAQDLISPHGEGCLILGTCWSKGETISSSITVVTNVHSITKS